MTVRVNHLLRRRLEAAGTRRLARRPTDADSLYRELLRAELARGTDFGDDYEHLLALRPAIDASGFRLLDGGRARKAAGCYYTPPEFIDAALDAALEPLLDEHGPDVRVLDPACGSGRFLVAAGERITRRGGDPATCLIGMDRDPLAVGLARAALRRAFGTTGRILCGDGLMARGRYDLVIGNPPFVNAIEGAGVAADLRHRFPQIRGAADLAYYFLARAMELVRPGGRVALVLPRPALCAPALADFRASLPQHLRPILIDAPDTSRRFRGALVFACLVVLGPGGTCRVRCGSDTAVGELSSSNWWAALNALIDGPPPVVDGPPLADTFEVTAGLTAAEAYDLRTFVSERPAARRGRLVTTGLIDPGVNHWGERTCRFLGRDYCHPVVTNFGLPGTLTRRLVRSHRPKLMIAGLSRRIECVIDADGAYLPSVGTFAIWHPTDDVSALAALGDWLHSPEVARLWRDALGANAVGGGDTVMTKAFLRSVPVTATAVCRLA
ncbi:MAG: N-6 DNA methylase [Gemmataceae bacterium]